MTSQASEDKKTEGSQYGHSSLSYNSYLKVHDLKKLQITQSNPPHHDEPLFIVIHQTYELWFKLILHEIDEVMTMLANDRLKRAIHFLRRVVAIMKVLVNQIHILETMSPQDFLGFRNNLNPASGFQSTQFREIEIVCGLRDKMVLDHFKHDQESWADLEHRINQPSLRNAFYNLLRRKGFILPESADTDDQLSDEDQ